jgi:hypothetical protein
MEERTNTKKGITKKNVKLQEWKDHMLINIKGYAKLAKHLLEEHMEYDGTNKDEVNPNGKHLWMQSMSMLKRENNMVKSKALKHMTAYE